MKTIAERVAEMVTDRAVDTIAQLAELGRILYLYQRLGKGWRAEEWRHMVRYEFSDGSAIVEAPGGWDVEGPRPFSWAGCPECGEEDGE